MPQLTTTSYALLGFLALEPFSAFELTGLMRTSGTRYLWPRTESRLYKEPHNLAAHGLVTGAEERHGRRVRTVYTITKDGRAALAAWLSEPGARPRTEHEALLKVFYANFGSLPQLRDQLAAVRRDLVDEYEALIETVELLRAKRHPFPDRTHLSQLVIEHVRLELAARSTWLRTAEDAVATWGTTRATAERRREWAAWLPGTIDDLRGELALLGEEGAR